MNFSNTLTRWYLENKRDLPWRKTDNPYLIWLSEIMLQQTRVAQGTPYFHSFTTNFPTVFDLAAANEEQVLKLWQGLGYYSRARNLHKTAQVVANELSGKFPDNYNDLSENEQIEILSKATDDIAGIDDFEDEMVVKTLGSMEAIRTIQESNGEKGANRYIISNNQSS